MVAEAGSARFSERSFFAAGRRWRPRIVWAVCAFALAGGLGAMPVEVTLAVELPAVLDVGAYRTIAPVPFLVGHGEGEGRIAGRDIDVQAELSRYLETLLRRETDLRVVPGANRVVLPTWDLEALAADRDFWRALGEQLDADLVMVGSIDFDVHDRSGYRTESYRSDTDGRTYRRQILVEETGFAYDVLVAIFDGRTGERLYDDNVKDFKVFEGERADPLAHLFQNLYALEERIVGVFARREVPARRLLFSD